MQPKGSISADPRSPCTACIKGRVSAGTYGPEAPTTPPAVLNRTFGSAATGPPATGDDDIGPLAFLVAFGPVQPQHHRFGPKPDILNVKCHKFRAPQRAGQAGEQQGTVAQGG